jgi:inhibitor of KinA sporulation pathway (predicted exonuclease)
LLRPFFACLWDLEKGCEKMQGNKIVLDLEFTPVRDPDLMEIAGSEILEIGAVKLDENNEILGEFQTYVKPQYSGIPANITRITGINSHTVAAAPSYSEAVEQFTQWIGTQKRSRFYTWSNSDQYVLLREANLKETNLEEMYYSHWIDLQRIHQRMYGFARPMNLTNALGSMQIYFVGTEHGALADARNTAKILQNLSSVEAVHQRIEASHITYNSTESHGFSMGLLFKKK